jgi:hypothetical protein
MKRKRRRPPSNVIKLFKPSRPPPLSTAAILEGFELLKVFWKIEDGRDRKTVLEVAKQLLARGAKNTR